MFPVASALANEALVLVGGVGLIMWTGVAVNEAVIAFNKRHKHTPYTPRSYDPSWL